MVSVVAALGLNLLTGYCGLISIGHASFMAVGAFTGAILASWLEFPFWAALLLAGVAGGLVTLIFGSPAIKVKGFYLALTTLAAQFILTWVLINYFQGGRGIIIARPSIIEGDRSFYYLALIAAIIMTFLAKNIARSKTGRAFVAIRDNDIAAGVLGVNVASYKLLACFIAGFFAGIAGFIWVAYTQWAVVSYFTLSDSIWYLGMIIVGGMGSIAGTIFGVIFIRGLDTLSYMLVPAITAAIPGTLGQNFGMAFSTFLFGLVILLFLIYEPRGLYHRWDILKNSIRLWPFTY